MSIRNGAIGYGQAPFLTKARATIAARAAQDPLYAAQAAALDGSAGTLQAGLSPSVGLSISPWLLVGLGLLGVWLLPKLARGR